MINPVNFRILIYFFITVRKLLNGVSQKRVWDANTTLKTLEHLLEKFLTVVTCQSKNKSMQTRLEINDLLLTKGKINENILTSKIINSRV